MKSTINENGVYIHTYYNFVTDLNITEEQIPFVDVSVLIESNKPVLTQLIERTKTWTDLWTIYGNSTLLVATDSTFSNDGFDENEESTFWQYKYLDYDEIAHKYHVEWDENWTYLGREIYWNHGNEPYPVLESTGEGHSFVKNMPYRYLFFYEDNGYYPELPYQQIKICRNKGATGVNNINPDYEVPEKYTFPNMIYYESEHHNYKPFQEIFWKKIQTKNGKGIKYRLNVRGNFYQESEKEINCIGEYSTYEDIYVPYHYKKAVEGGYKYYSCYILDQSSSGTEHVTIYKSQETSSKVKLLVTYINKNNKIETKIVKQ